MRLLIAAVPPVRLPHVEGQIVLVQPFLRVVIIFPDKAALLPVFRNHAFPENFRVLVDGIHVEQEDPVRIEIIVRQAEDLEKIGFLRNVIQGVADADDGPHRTVQLELPHILQKIEDIMAGFFLLFIGQLQHLLRGVHADHVVAGPRQKLRHAARAAAQVQHQSVLDSVFLQVFRDPVSPFLIGNAVHEQIVDRREARVCVHPPLLPQVYLIIANFP